MESCEEIYKTIVKTLKLIILIIMFIANGNTNAFLNSAELQ